MLPGNQNNLKQAADCTLRYLLNTQLANENAESLKNGEPGAVNEEDKNVIRSFLNF